MLAANDWMQNPVGAHFNTATLRMELTSFYEMVFNAVAQAKFVHTVSAGYVTGAIFVLAVRAFYLLRGHHRHQPLWLRRGAAPGSGLRQAQSVVFPDSLIISFADILTSLPVAGSPHFSPSYRSSSSVPPLPATGQGYPDKRRWH
jgi:hypothetical protein